jgi:hypothetical protein
MVVGFPRQKNGSTAAMEMQAACSLAEKGTSKKVKNGRSGEKMN